MSPPGEASAQGTLTEPGEVRAIGDRIEQVLDGLRASAPEPVVQRVEELVALVSDLYGAGLVRVIELTGADVDQLVGDDLVSSLLVLHGLHPQTLTERVEDALASVRPYLGSHGGDVELAGVDEEQGAVLLRMLGSCDGCPSSSVTLTLAVEEAITAAAPEISRIEVDGATRPLDRDLTPIALTAKPGSSNGVTSPTNGRA